MISFRSNELSLKYTRCTPLGCKDVEIRQFNFVTKTLIKYKHLIVLPNCQIKNILID